MSTNVVKNLNHRTQQICSCDKSPETEIQKLLDREPERMSSDAAMETVRAAELVEELESLGGLDMEEVGQGVSGV